MDQILEIHGFRLLGTGEHGVGMVKKEYLMRNCVSVLLI
jgi:hypothetical protein